MYKITYMVYMFDNNVYTVPSILWVHLVYFTYEWNTIYLFKIFTDVLYQRLCGLMDKAPGDRVA